MNLLMFICFSQVHAVSLSHLILVSASFFCPPVLPVTPAPHFPALCASEEVKQTKQQDWCFQWRKYGPGAN